MKHTIKIDINRAVVVEPEGEAVAVRLTTFGVAAFSQRLDVHQAQALGLALVQSAQQAGPGVRCHGDLCRAGQQACPSPEACGVKP